MISKILNFWHVLKGNLWFIPALFCLGFMSATIAAYYIESHYLQNLELPDYLFKGTTNDAKSVTVTLLSAMITMATLAISITIVVLSLAASQLGPRLIKTFMSDGRTKDFIGLFFGTVVACFVLTVILHSRTSEAIPPQITISAVFVLCFINLFVLLGFVHHVAHSCIADHVIIQVSQDLKTAINRLMSDQARRNPDGKPLKESWPKDFEQVSRSICFERAGYIQNIDYEKILGIAEHYSGRVHIHFKAGRFLVKGENGVQFYSKSELPDDIDDEIRDCFILGNDRTPTQDLEYSMRHLVEIAIRALSPGINDSFTAMSVLDHLSESLAMIFEKEQLSSGDFYDETGILRIRSLATSESDIIFSAFEQIRYHAYDMADVIRHMIQKIEALSSITDNAQARSGLLIQVEGMKADISKIDRYIGDRQDLIAKLKNLQRTLRP